MNRAKTKDRQTRIRNIPDSASATDEQLRLDVIVNSSVSMLMSKGFDVWRLSDIEHAIRSAVNATARTLGRIDHPEFQDGR